MNNEWLSLGRRWGSGRVYPTVVEGIVDVAGYNEWGIPEDEEILAW